jgi:hypothetical protein
MKEMASKVRIFMYRIFGPLPISATPLSNHALKNASVWPNTASFEVSPKRLFSVGCPSGYGWMTFADCALVVLFNGAGGFQPVDLTANQEIGVPGIVLRVVH